MMILFCRRSRTFWMKSPSTSCSQMYLFTSITPRKASFPWLFSCNRKRQTTCILPKSFNIVTDFTLAEIGEPNCHPLSWIWKKSICRCGKRLFTDSFVLQNFVLFEKIYYLHNRVNVLKGICNYGYYLIFTFCTPNSNRYNQHKWSFGGVLGNVCV